MTPSLSVRAVRWPEVRPGDDLAALVVSGVDLSDGDVLVLTSKVVSKAEGLMSTRPREDAIAAQTRRVVARRGALVIAETPHGLVMAAGGVDSSNTPAGTSLVLPPNPDASARRLRADLFERTGRNLAVVVSDTAGRAWRLGQTDIAIGCAGIVPVTSLRGELDSHGNVLQVTAPAIADELAAAADLVKGKRSESPLAVVSGFAEHVLPVGEHGAGAVALVRPATDDLFALGTREAAVAAIARDDARALEHFPGLVPGDLDPFSRLTPSAGVAVTVREVAAPLDRPRSAPTVGTVVRGWLVEVLVPDDAATAVWVRAGRAVEQVHALAAAHRLTRAEPPEPAPPMGLPRTVVDRALWVTS